MRNKYAPLERVLLGMGVCSKSFDMRAGVSSRVSTCRRLPKVLRCKCMCCDNERTDPIEKGAFWGWVCLQEF